MINQFRGLGYYVILTLLVYLTRDQLLILTPYLFCVMIPTVLLRQVELRRNLKKRLQGGRRGYIYAFSDIGQLLPTIKIGRETEKGSRMRSHRTAAPFGCIVWCNFWVGDSVYAESYLHERYRWYRINSRFEWFFILNPLMLIDLILLGKFNRDRY